MEYAKRDEALGNWNFTGEDLYWCDELKKKKDIVNIGKEMIKRMNGLIKVKMEKEDILGKDYHLTMVYGIGQYGGATLTCRKAFSGAFRCGECDADTPEKKRGAVVALYRQVVPEVLKTYPQIKEYSVAVSYNSVFDDAAIQLDLVFS